jgi:hypothetical protein
MGFIPMSKSNWGENIGVRISGSFPVCINCVPVCVKCGFAIPSEKVLEYGFSVDARLGNGACQHMNFKYFIAAIFKRFFQIGRFGAKENNVQKRSLLNPGLFTLALSPSIFFATGEYTYTAFDNSLIAIVVAMAVVFASWNRITKLNRWLLGGAGIPLTSKYQLGAPRASLLGGAILGAPIAIYIYWRWLDQEYGYGYLPDMLIFVLTAGALGYLLVSVIIRAIFWVMDGFLLDKPTDG